MVSIDDNRRNWNRDDAWTAHGDEWSQAWGGTRSLWFGSIVPRIADYLPAGHVLEIASGHGRITEFLLRHCDRLTGVDLAPNCVEFCRERFAAVAHARFALTDGCSLAQVDKASVDFAFSWDSLVHADRTAIDGYLLALAEVLVPGGHAFLHHSQLGAYRDEASGSLTVANTHWRDETVSAAFVARQARAAGLQCLAQELLQWGGDVFNDCFTLLRRPLAGEPLDVATRHSEHPSMNSEIAHFARLATLYGRG